MGAKDILPLNLSDFGVSETRGFLPDEDPRVLHHSDCIEKPDRMLLYRFQEIAHDIPKLLVVGKVRDVIRKESQRFLEEYYNRDRKFNIAALFEDRIDLLETAMRIFSFLGNAYVWQSSEWKSSTEHVKEVLPKGLAIVWYQVARALGRHPSLSYASYALHNWRRIDPEGPISADNVVLINNFLAGLDEDWFVTIHVDIEAKMGTVPKTMLEVFPAIYYDNPEIIIEKLKHIVSCQEDMYKTMCRMTERCIPSIYYDRVRPYINGWKNNPALLDGLYYPGVEEYDGNPQQFRGETGAQSSIIPMLDAFYGVEYPNDPFSKYLLEMREYMPLGHRRFIEAVRMINKGNATMYSYAKAMKSKYPEIAFYVKKSGELAVQFLEKHFDFVHKYIFSRTQQNAANPTATGTGGTDMMRYLEIHMETRRKHFDSI